MGAQRRRRSIRCSAFATALLGSTQAEAQRTSENAVTAAEDAFGTSIGAETIGLYDSSRVRGFSPTAAGNVRIDGLYFDQVWGLSSRIRQSTTIRVGLSTLGFPFPSPTGVVDYAVRRPGDEASLSTFGSINSYGAAFVELDAVLPLIPGELSVGGGAGLYRNEFYNGTDSWQNVEGAMARWRPSDAVEIMPFWARSDIHDDNFGPTYLPAGAFLPPRVERRDFNGPIWSRYSGVATNYGLLARYAPSENWLIRGGLFRSFFDDHESGANLLTDLTVAGTGRQLVIVDPRAKSASTSGELRLTRSLPDGPRLHNFHLAVRARRRTVEYGGSDLVDLGEVRIGEEIAAPEPAFRFSEQSQDQVRQWTAGLAYEGRWRGVGEISLGLQKTDYRKTVLLPGLLPQTTASRPWLYNGTVAIELRPRLHIYAGYAKGLEESGVAPDNAVNRDEPLAAILTSQRDAGIRWSITDRLRLVAGLFDVRKPYFNLDASGRFTLLGDVKHQGIEVSLAGPVTPRLNIVAGAVLLRPRVTGEGVELGRVGRLPVGQAATNIRFNADWRLAVLDGLSLDLGITYLSQRPSTRDNLVFLPARTLADIGGRYRFRLAGNDASLRISITNLFNVYYFDLRGSGAYDLTPGRVATGSLAVDF